MTSVWLEKPMLRCMNTVPASSVSLFTDIARTHLPAPYSPSSFYRLIDASSRERRASAPSACSYFEGGRTHHDGVKKCTHIFSHSSAAAVSPTLHIETQRTPSGASHALPVPNVRRRAASMTRCASAHTSRSVRGDRGLTIFVGAGKFRW